MFIPLAGSEKTQRMILSLSEISKKYGSRTILKNVSLNFHAASITLLTGANGAGKSTLLKIMAGLCKPSSGTVSLNCNSAYLGHNTWLYPGLSALENLSFWQKLYTGQAEKNTLIQALEQVGLKRFALEKAATFSRGMAQRLNLARVLLLKPDLLLLDEPDSGLDAASLNMLTQEICKTKNRGGAIIWVSHHFERDINLADQLIVLDKQQLSYVGKPGAYTC